MEDNVDPLTLGRVKVRCFGIHPEDRQDVPTKDLPWATTVQPNTSASISGIGQSPNGLEQGSWVIGFFADGERAQFPIVLGSLPGIHRPEQPGGMGGSAAGWIDPNAQTGGTTSGTQPYHTDSFEKPQTGVSSYYGQHPSTGGVVPGQGITPPQGGSIIKDAPNYVTRDDIPRWNTIFKKLSYQKANAHPQGIACNGTGLIKLHVPSGLALEQLMRDFGKDVSINSGYRSPQYNRTLSGAAKNSMHIQGRAFDISYGSIGGGRRSAALEKFIKTAVKDGFTGFGLYNSFIHIDTGNARTWGSDKSWLHKVLRGAGWSYGKKPLDNVRSTPGTSNADSGTVNDTVQGSDGANVQTGNVGNDAVSSTGTLKTRQDIADRIVEVGREKGLSEAAIAGHLATVEIESTFDPSGYNRKEGAVGLGQWRGSRRTNMENFVAKNYPNDPVEGQIQFFYHEMETTHKRAGDQIKSATTVEEAAAGWSNYERHKNYNKPGSSEYQERLNLARKYLGQRASSVPNGSLGFRDPTGSLPFKGYRGTPSTHHSARGVNSYDGLHMASPYRNHSGRATNVPGPGYRSNFGAPPNPANPQYPYNHTMASKSGHLIEMDDTPRAERLNIQHKSGTNIEIGPHGVRNDTTIADLHSHVKGQSYQSVAGDMYVTSKGNMNLMSTSDMNIHGNGNLKIEGRNGFELFLAGDFDIRAGEECNIRVNRLNIEAAEINILSTGNLYQEAEGDMHLKAGGNFFCEAAGESNIKSDGNMKIAGNDVHIKGPTVYIDDVVRMAEGGAEEAADALAAINVDLGDAPTKVDVEQMKQDSKQFSSPGMDDAHEMYGTQEALQQYGDPTKSNRQAGDGKAGEFLDLVGKAEGTDKGDGYNETLGYGAYTNGDVDLTNMTLDQIDALQTDMLNHPNNNFNSSAVGRYQVVRTTLRDVRSKLGLTGDMKFTPQLQDRIGGYLAQRRGSGVSGLRNEWEGLRGVSSSQITAAYKAQFGD